MQRAGNPLKIYWNFNLRTAEDEVEVFPLEGKPLRLTLITPRGKKELIDYAVKGSVIEWDFASDYQKAYGDYSLMLEVLSPSGKVLMTSDQCGFVRLTDKSCFSQGATASDTITLSSELTIVRIMPVYPEIGENGNWWVDGVDTGHSSIGTSAYEYALSLGYEGTEEEYAAECLAVPVLNEESRIATAAALEATEQSIAQQESVDNTMQGVQGYMDNVVAPAITSAQQATENAENAAENANNASEEASTSASQAAAAAASANDAAGNADAAAEEAHTAAQNAEGATKRAEEAIEAFGPAIANKADKIKFEGKSYVETDGISTDDFYYSMPDSADGTEDDIIATKSNLKKINGQDLFGKGNIVIEGKNYDNEIAELSAEIEGKEDKANKTTTLSSASTDTQYPSARAAFMAISKKSEVSLETLANGNLKVTIDGVSKDFMAATPSGDPMHYNYIVVGALYNDTDSAIARTDYFGNAVSHLPGRWYVEGLGDLTNAEMREVYEAGKWWENVDRRGFISKYAARAILPSLGYEQVTYKGEYNFTQSFNQCKNLEVVDLRTQVSPADAVFQRVKINYFDFGCQGSPKIKCIYGIINATATSGDSSYWLHTAGLMEVRLFNIKVGIKFPLAKNISKASILYMIENEAATNAIAITLHADAYARLSADEDIVAALAAHPKVSLAKA